jgi:hypothetical protein
MTFCPHARWNEELFQQSCEKITCASAKVAAAGLKNHRSISNFDMVRSMVALSLESILSRT